MVHAKVQELVRRLLEVTLDPPDRSNNFVFLAELAQELIDEGLDLELSKEKLDRLLMARLMLPKEGQASQWTIDYLLGVYTRASDAKRNLGGMKDQALAKEMDDVCNAVQELAISHTNLALTLEIFPQSTEEKDMGPRALLSAINPALIPPQSRLGMVNYRPVNSIPAGFLERYATQYEEEGLTDTVEALCGHFIDIFHEMSILAEFFLPMQTFIDLVSVPPIARSVAKSERWKAHAQSGRAFAETTILGSMFCISSLQDIDYMKGPRGVLRERSPKVVEDLFGEGSNNAHVSNGIFAIRTNLAGLRGQLKSIVMTFLKTKGTKDAMLDWLGTALEVNNEFNKEMMNASIAAPRGFMSNLSAVLLELCGPFLDFQNGKAKDKIDAWYCLRGERLDYSNETRLHMTPEEETSQLERINSHAQAEASQNRGGQVKPYSPHFICECYFMTLKGLHMGYIGCSKLFETLHRQIHRLKQELAEMETQMQRPSPDNMKMLIEMQMRGMKVWLRRLTGMSYCLTAELGEPGTVDSVVRFYRLTAYWLLTQASPQFANNLPLQLPLPSEAPISFRGLPEYIISDLADFFKLSPGWLDHGQVMQTTSQIVEVILCSVAFMPASSYINNIYLRAQLAEILHSFMPEEEEEEASWGRRRRRGNHGTELVTLMATSEVIKNNLVKGLLQLFVEVERTGRSNQFYEKFYIRWDLGRLLKHLWEDPTHREVWVALSHKEEDLYSRFNYFLETDATLHLDDALKLLQEIKVFERLPPEQQTAEERQGEHERQEGTAKFHLQHAKLLLEIIKMTAPIIWQPWLQEQAVKRIAGTLNYFLKYLTGPEKGKLKIRDPKRLDFAPKEFLELIAAIYVHFARKDQNNAFAQAIAADKRSYYSKMFTEAATVLREHRLLEEHDIQELDNLAIRTAHALQILEQEDAAEAEAPEEFFDPIMSEIMSDPVTLPSGINMDRENILRHMMSDPTDPFSRVPLTAADLRPNEELKARIQEWRRKTFSSSSTPMES